MYSQVQGDIVGQAQVPFVLHVARLATVQARLADIEVAVTGGARVFHNGLPRLDVVSHVAIQEMGCPRGYPEVTSAHGEVHAEKLGSVPRDGDGIVLQSAGASLDHATRQSKRQRNR